MSRSARCGPAALSRHHCLPSAVPQSASEAPSPRFSKHLGAPFLQQPCSGLAFPSMPFHVGTIQSTSREPARSHPRRALGGSGPESNIGILEPVRFQNASRFTGPSKSNTLRLPRRHTRVVSYARGQGVSYARGQGVAQRCCLLRASALQPESLGSVLRVSCDSHAHDTRGV